MTTLQTVGGQGMGTSPVPARDVMKSGRLDRRKALRLFLRSLQVADASKVSYGKALNVFFNWVEAEGRDLTFLQRQDIIDYYDSLHSEGTARQPRTVSLYLCAVRLFYKWLSSTYGFENIAADVKGERTRHSSLMRFEKEPLTETQASLLLTYFKEYHESRPERHRKSAKKVSFRDREEITLRNYAMVSLMLRCGLRTIEVSRLDVMNVAVRAGHRVLYIWGKGHARPGEGRQPDDYVRLTDAAYRPVADYLAYRGQTSPSAPLFASVGHGTEGHRLTERTVQLICKTGLRAIGLDDPAYTPHSLRHTTGDRLAELGISLTEIQGAMRHQNPATTEIYISQAMEKSRLENPALAALDDCFNTIDDQ